MLWKQSLSSSLENMWKKVKKTHTIALDENIEKKNQFETSQSNIRPNFDISRRKE